MSQPVNSLFITLRRSLAGVRENHKGVIKSLGLKNRQQTVEKENLPWVRGAISKVGRQRIRRSFVGSPRGEVRDALAGRRFCSLDQRNSRQG